jgi:dipeptidase
LLSLHDFKEFFVNLHKISLFIQKLGFIITLITDLKHFLNVNIEKASICATFFQEVSMLVNRTRNTKLTFGIAVLASVLMLFLAALPLGATESSSYQAGFAVGSSQPTQIEEHIAEMKLAAQNRGVDYATVLAAAKEREALVLQILPEKVEWMHGVADASGIPYEDILVYNTADKLMTGFVGECTTFLANGKALAAGAGSIISKNRDLGPNTISEVAKENGGDHASTEIYKAAYIDIPQASHTYSFVGSRSAGRWGYGMGINEFQVIVSDNDAPTRDELTFANGLHDNDYVRLVLERAKTAREGVQILTKLTEKYGQAWNAIMFEIGDPQELWVVEITGKRWVARRYQDTYTARSNQFQITDDYEICSHDLLTYAQSQGWIGADVTKINFRAIYGTTELYPENNDNIASRPAVETLYNTEMRYERAMELLQGIAGNISAQTLMPCARDHYDTYTLPSGEVLTLNQVPYYSTDYVYDRQEWMTEPPTKDTVEVSIFPRAICHHAFEGTTAATGILIARPDVPNELGLMIHAYDQPCNSLFIPFYVGASSVDTRYSTPEAGSRFLTISKLAFGCYTTYHEGIRSVFDPYEKALFTEMPAMEKNYVDLKAAGKTMAAQAALDAFCAQHWTKGFELADTALKTMVEETAASSAWGR